MNILGMFARRPEPGKCKTRLAASIGAEAASEIYAAFVTDLHRRCPALADEFVVAMTPEEQQTGDWFEKLRPPNGRLEFQPDGDLGDRITWFFNTAAASAQHHVVLIGSDSPDLPSHIISSAFSALMSNDVVISPASDGGYVLIGLSVAPGPLFCNINWSSSSTLADTLAACEQNDFTVKLLSPWYDIDTIDDLQKLRESTSLPADSNAVCPNTVRAIQASLNH